jgi:anti-sigma-K factor RskA
MSMDREHTWRLTATARVAVVAVAVVAVVAVVVRGRSA